MAPTWKKYLKRIDDKDKDTQIEALQELGYLKADMAVTDITKLIQKDNVDFAVRAEAIKALGDIGDTSVGPLLITLLKEDEIVILMEVVIALGKLCSHGFTKGIEPLEKMLDHEHPRILKYTIRALGRAGASDSIKQLYPLLRDEDARIELKEEVTLAIGEIGGPKALKILKDLLFPSDEFPKLEMQIRRAAITSLGKAQKPKTLELLGKAYRKTESKIIKKYAEAAIEKTVDGAKNRYKRIKRRAKEILKSG